MKRILNLIAASTSEKVALSLIGYFQGDDGARLLTHDGATLVEVFAPVLWQLSMDHWSHVVKQSASGALMGLRNEYNRQVEQAITNASITGAPPQVAKWMGIFKTATRDQNVSLTDEYDRLMVAYPVKTPRAMPGLRLSRARAASEKASVVKPRWTARSLF
jgi:hypothetical protein